eukprot:TRINITY_DN7596_c0_g10_i1.p4 TRINITY_DN7596_c0_g10~~TRINITY_DN7596_c0_g10_i1.p4  ORF type:complete len:114 (-),score=2.81 TRINITY_DN7596_c0_g10_i1:140-481(-)
METENFGLFMKQVEYEYNRKNFFIAKQFNTHCKETSYFQEWCKNCFANLQFFPQQILELLIPQTISLICRNFVVTFCCNFLMFYIIFFIQWIFVVDNEIRLCGLFNWYGGNIY